ncbi:MAG: fatty acid cis/trans isomerase [Myxococcales bacterium]
MTRRAILAALPTLAVLACIQTALPPVMVETTTTPTVGYVNDVTRILDRRCVVCHSCYNAACQLKLGSFEGLDRGGSKDAIYVGSRLRTQDPTRLFVDAQTTEAWRKKGFHSVTHSDATGAYNSSVMLHLLDAKRKQPVSSGEYHAEAANLTCAADEDEVGGFLAKHPERGMPFGFPPLAPAEFATLAAWLQQGANGPNRSEQHALTTPDPAVKREIEKWESFLNRVDAKHAMTARYLYEHLFLGHLYFADADAKEFYRVIRSTTPPGKAISIIATVRPYDDPGVTSFYYRFQKIHSTIVHKTHMVVELDNESLARLEKNFIDTPWLEEPHWVEFDDKTAANPFVVYAQIPPVVRYRFLLNNAEYILRNFIRGPVCKGQVALNVIHDHFWVMFLDPAADQTVQDPDFLFRQSANLVMPNEKGSDERLVRAFSNRYRDRYLRFYRAKVELYDEKTPDGLGIDAIWKGERPQDAPFLTIYRHFDSATVLKGAHGDLPRTLWVIDYSQFERIFYSLVAGFDVFGNLSHQANVRRYMDYLRIEGELNFVSFLPKAERLPTVRSWYEGDGAFDNADPDRLLHAQETKVRYQTADTKREFTERVVESHILESTEIEFDVINYRRDEREVPMPKSFETHEDILNGFRALTAPGTGFIRHVTRTDVNLLYVRINGYMGEARYFTIVINRWHDNVNSMFGEQNRLDATKDTIDFLPGTIGSYPNYFLEVEARDLPDFFDMLENFDGTEEYVAKTEKYGVNRADEGFWSSYDRFQGQLDQSDPLNAGLYDLNRYYPIARASD